VGNGVKEGRRRGREAMKQGSEEAKNKGEEV
jgi:hypothetical protein